MNRKLKGKSVVVTGASSGIGRATALELGRRGAWLTLIARREEPLESLAREVERLGGRALVHPCDVTDADCLTAAAREANATYGGIDAWVNNAGVFVVGELEQTPDEAFHRAMEVNFHAQVYGARAVLPFFRARNAGVLINVGSVESRLTSPYSSAYAASKFAVRGWSGSLRQELAHSKIRVCTVLPPSTDTPLFEHTANYSGKKVKPIEPVIAPERVARAIVGCIQRPRPEVVVGAQPRLLLLLDAVAPKLASALRRKDAEKKQFQPEPQAPTEGNLFQPMAEGQQTRGGWKDRSVKWARQKADAVRGGGVHAFLVGKARARREGRRLDVFR